MVGDSTSKRKWHRVLSAAMSGSLSVKEQNELFIEYALASDHLRIDLLYIQSQKPGGAGHPIAQVFREYNVVELKSPSERLGPAGYHQGVTYVRLLQQRYTPRDHYFTKYSLSLICTQTSKGLYTFLESIDLKVIRDSPVPGIMQVEGELFPVQIVVLDLLTDPEIAFPFTPYVSKEVREQLRLVTRLLQEINNDLETGSWSELLQFCLDHCILTDHEFKEVMEMQWHSEEQFKKYQHYVELARDTRIGRILLEEGMQEGRQEGRQEERMSLIRTAISNGADLSYLMKVIGIPESEVRKVQREM